jgi:ATP-binding cassette subfamily F protein 3
MLEKMKPIARDRRDRRRPPFSFPEPVKGCRRRSSPSRASVGYQPGKPILKRLDLRIDDDDRIALLGANGNGKSTFAKLISGRLKAMGGIVTRAPG